MVIFIFGTMKAHQNMEHFVRGAELLITTTALIQTFAVACLTRKKKKGHFLNDHYSFLPCDLLFVNLLTLESKWYFKSNLTFCPLNSKGAACLLACTTTTPLRDLGAVGVSLPSLTTTTWPSRPSRAPYRHG